MSEILLILLIALIVIRPERLPEVAHTIGRFLGMAKKQIHHIKETINEYTQFKSPQDRS